MPNQLQAKHSAIWSRNEDNKQWAGRTPWSHEHQLTYVGPESLLEEPSYKGRNLRRTSLISKTVAQRRARFAGHCFRAKDQVISDPLLWRLPCPRRGKSPLIYPDTSSRDTGLILGELAQAMADRALWYGAVSAGSTAVEWLWSYWKLWFVEETFTWGNSACW